MKLPVLKRRLAAASKRAARASGHGIASAWRASVRALAFAWQVIVSHLGSKAAAIIVMAIGAYLMARSVWPAGAGGLGLATWGGLTLVVALRQDDKALAAALKKALGE
jgi:predicted phage tail protein